MIQLNKLAFVTQSYKDDYNECVLLCESMDRFVPEEIRHYIFVNDEDYELFKNLGSHRRIIFKKSKILPSFLFRCPFKFLGHHYHLSLITIPVREWIIQQICKLGVFEVIPKEIEAVFNIDSESIFMKPFNINKLYKNGKYLLYKTTNQCEPNYEEYCCAAKKLLKLSNTYEELSQYNFMSTPVCFVRSNIESMLSRISKNSIWKNWKIALCNTYRFSEYYLYGIYVTFVKQTECHYNMTKYLFPMIDMLKANSISDLEMAIVSKLNFDSEIMGIWLQKSNRKRMTSKYQNYNDVRSVIHKIWESGNNL